MRKGLIRALALAKGKWIGPATYRLWPWLLSGGLVPWTDDSVAYSKLVPVSARKATVDSIGGRSVCVNQLISSDAVFNTNRADKEDITGGTRYTVNSVAYNFVGFFVMNDNLTTKIVSGHKYIVYFNIESQKDGTIDISLHAVNFARSIPVSANVKKTITAMGTAGDVLTNGFVQGFYITNIAIGDSFDVTDYRVVDLTQWFGSGNEPSSVDDPRMQEVYAYLDAHPEYNAGSIKSADVESVVVKDADEAVTKTEEIPQAIRELEGYGWSAGSVYNEVDYERKVFIKRVGKVDLGTLDFVERESSESYPYGFFYFTADIGRKAGELNLICAEYITKKGFNSDRHLFGNKSNGLVYFIDSSYIGDLQGFKQHLSGKYLYYDLATPVETDISSLIPDGFLTNLPVEAGGSMTFKSDSELAVPSEVTYKLKLDEADQYIQDQYDNDLGGILV